MAIGLPGALEILVILVMIACPIVIVVTVLAVTTARRKQAPPSPNLVLCPDCGQNVSTSAAACPHCGRPMVPTKENI